jgi:hypothetical protein
MKKTYIIGKIFSGRLTVIEIVLDSEIFPWSARIVACRQDDSTIAYTIGFGTYGSTHRGCTHYTTGWNPNVGDTIAGHYPANDWYRFIVVISPIPGHD